MDYSWTSEMDSRDGSDMGLRWTTYGLDMERIWILGWNADGYELGCIWV